MNARPIYFLLFALLACLPGAGAGAPNPEEDVLAPELLQVYIRGIQGELLNNVRAALSVEKNRRANSLSQERIRELHERGTPEIYRALQPFGFYRPEVEARLIPPSHLDGPWRSSFVIDPGPPLPIATLDIRLDQAGEPDPELATIMAALPLQIGTTLDHRNYESAKSQIVQQLRALGYLDVDLVEHLVEVDLANYEANVRLHVSTGSLYVVGDISFEQDLFSAEYLARYLVLEPGEPYSNTRLAYQRRVLSRSGHFMEVEILPLATLPSERHTIPLKIVLQPYPPNRYRGRVGWGTDTGLGLQLDWTRRHIGKRGQSFTLGGAVVEERNRLAGDLSYLIPLDPLSGNQIELAARHESKDLTFEDVDLDQGGETRIATNLASTFWHLPHNSWGSFSVDTTVGGSFVSETYDIFEVLFGNLPDESQDAIIESIGQEAYATLAPEFEALVPSLRLTMRRSDSPLYIREGDYLQFDLLGASESLGSNIDFWQARFYGWNIRPVFDRGRVLLRTAFGYSDAESRTVLGVNFNQMPEYYEFRAGGARSVRGYGFETLFPVDTLTGGKHQLVASLEYEHEIIPDWSAAVFVDGGNAFNDFDDIDPKTGAGIGVRWRSPVGLARIDLAFPLDDADESFQIHITVGPEF